MGKRLLAHQANQCFLPMAKARGFQHWKDSLTWQDAQAALDDWQGYKDPTLHVYACTCCGGYHLGRYATLALLAASWNALRVA